MTGGGEHGGGGAAAATCRQRATPSSSSYRFLSSSEPRRLQKLLEPSPPSPAAGSRAALLRLPWPTPATPSQIRTPTSHLLSLVSDDLPLNLNLARRCSSEQGAGLRVLWRPRGPPEIWLRARRGWEGHGRDGRRRAGRQQAHRATLRRVGGPDRGLQVPHRAAPPPRRPQGRRWAAWRRRSTCSAAGPILQLRLTCETRHYIMRQGEDT